MKKVDIPATVAQAARREGASPEGEQTIRSATTLLQHLGIDLALTPTTARPREEPPTVDLRTPEGPTHRRDGDTTGGGAQLGRFTLGKELGKGGMGRVVEAHDPELMRDVAVKLLLDPSDVNEVQLARFVAEAQITAQLDHPNIVPVHELGLAEDGRLFFVMRRVRGRSLRQVIRDLRADDPATTMAWNEFGLLMAFSVACAAVAHAHERGVLHRDLKPRNVMVGELGEVFVVDWGVARMMGDSSERLVSRPVDHLEIPRTLDGAVIGTPGYMSPEQIRGEIHTLDERADIFGLGAILYELLTREPAYPQRKAAQLLARTLEGPPVDPRERTPDLSVPHEMAQACLKAMAPRRGDRFASAFELGTIVRSYLDSRAQPTGGTHRGRSK